MSLQQTRMWLQNNADILLAVCLGLTFFCMYSPGIFTYDTHLQYQQALSGEYTDWHPPVMALLWRVLIKTTGAVSSLLALHTLLFYSGVVLCLRAFPISLFWRCVGILFVTLFPVIVTHQGVVWKDILFCSSFLCAAGLIAHIPGKDRRRSRWFAIVLICIVLFLATSARHNGPLPVFPFCVLFALQLTRGAGLRKQAIMTACIYIGIVLPAVLANHLLVNKSGPYPTQVVFLYDLSAISIKDRGSYFPDYISEDKAKELKETFNVDCVTTQQFALLTTEDSEVQALRSMWISTLLSHPLTYLSARFELFSNLLGFGKFAPCIPVHPIYEGSNPDLRPSTLRDLGYSYSEALSRGPVFGTWLYIGICIFFLIRNIVSRWSLLIMALSSSALLNMISLFPAAHSCDFRYTYWTVVAGLMIFLFMTLSQFSSKSKCSSCSRKILPPAEL